MNGNRCIRNLLKLICLLQDNSTNNFPMDDGCIKPFLGPRINRICYNTRVLTLYKKNGKMFKTSYFDSCDNITKTSGYFRVCNIKDDCCTLLILTTEEDKFISTNQFITVNLKCICAIKCLGDVAIDNL